MKNHKSVSNLKTLLTAIIVTCVISSSPICGSPGVVTVVEEGSGIETASYIISKQGSTYYVKNGTTGEIVNLGTNSTTLISSVINALPSSGGSIFLRAGEYEPIVINRNYVTIFGEGYGFSTGASAQTEGTGITKIKSTIDKDLIIVNGTTKLQGITIKYLYLYGSGKTNGHNGIYIEDVDQPVIEHVQVHNVETGIYLKDVDAGHIYKNTVLWCGSGVRIIGWGYNKVVDNELSDNLAYGIRVSSTAWCNRIIGNTFAKNNLTGIQVSGSQGNQIIGNTIIGCREGISLTSTSTWNIVSENVVYDSNKTGIWLSSSDNNTVSNNQVWNNGREATSTYSGIALTSSDWNTLIGNTVSDNYLITQKWGISEEGSSDYNVMIGDICRGNAVGGITQVGSNTKINHCWNGTTWIG